MIIISDTSAISNLIQIRQIELLKTFYGQVIITPAVQKELFRIKSHIEVISQFDWIIVKSPQNTELIFELNKKLDLGESESIALAIELDADFVLIDEYLGREFAKNYNLKVIGVLGILIKAKRDGYIDMVKPEIQKLQSIGFRLNSNLIQFILKGVNER